MTTRRTRIVLAAVGAVVVAVGATATGAAVSGDHAATASGLSLAGEPADFCYGAPTPSDWTGLAQRGLSFGVDAVTLTTDDEVHVTRVTPTAPSGGLRLTRAVFVPGAQVGDGQPGDQAIGSASPVLAAFARPVPATLIPVAKPPAVVDPVWQPRIWQLVVVVTAPQSSADARTPGFTITYSDHGTSTTLTTRDAVRLVRSASGCSPAKTD